MTGDDKAGDQPATAAADNPDTTAGPANDETTIVPPITTAAPALAWSVDEDETEQLDVWRDAVGRAALPLFAIAAALLLFLVVFWVWLKWPEQEKVDDNRMAWTTVTTAPPWSPPIVQTSTVPPVTSTVQAAPPTTVTVQAPPRH